MATRCYVKLLHLQKGINRLFCRENIRNVATSASTRNSKLGQKMSYINMPGAQPLQGITIGNLVQSAPDRFGDRLAVIDREQGIRKTHLELQKDVYKLATGFLALNFQRGDRIAIWCPNRYEWMVTQFAAAITGLILAPMNPAYQPLEVEHCLPIADIRAVVTQRSFKTQDYYQMLTKIIPEISDSKPGQIRSRRYPHFDTLIVIADVYLPGAFRYSDVINAGGSEAKLKLDRLLEEIEFDDVVSLLFTSGTTGTPKAATLTHFGIVNCGIELDRQLRYFDGPHRICCHVPLFHIIGCNLISCQSLVSGLGVVFPSQGYEPEESLTSIEEEKCTSIYGTPTMFIDLLEHPDFEKTNLSSVSRGFMAGAPCPPRLIRNVIEKMNCPGLVIGYGTTELSSTVSSQNTADPVNLKLHNVGKVAGHAEVKVVDSNNKIVPLGVPGEICVRSFQVMQGYWKDEEKTKEVIKNGWYHTGDVGTLDEDGNVALVGRIKDMIIRGGENIYPKEIEDHLISHPKIADAQVIGVPDNRLGEQVCVWIKLQNGQSLTENEIRTFCQGKLSKFKIPHYIHFVDDFPKTLSGKILKRKLKEEMSVILKAKQG